MRLFVAVDLPADEKSRLERLRADIPGAAWVRREALHLTLQFLGGDVAEDRLPDILAALETVRAAPFELALEGVGRFPPGDRKPPRVLWVGLSRSPDLETLYRRVVAATAAVGFPADERGFSPHITLARLKRSEAAAPAAAFLARQRSFRSAPFAVREFILFSSLLTPQGARYTREAVYRLED